MIDFALQIARFSLQAVVIVLCLLVVIGFIASLISKSKSQAEVEVTDLNKKLKANRMSLLRKSLSKKEFKQVEKQEKNLKKAAPEKKTVFVLNFDGDIKASATEQLREEITTLLGAAKPGDQVVVKVESPGGMVHGYGLAASQLIRIKKANLPLTICVDKIAASGGYMMACIADKIVAAPFAIIGSIGVIASVPNIYKVLKKHDVDYLEITAGEFKRTLTPLGEVTEPKLNKFKEQIEQVHELFKTHVVEQRQNLDLHKVATGEYWYGQQAINLNLIDELGTSDDLILNLSKDHHVLAVKFAGKKSLKDKISESLASSTESFFSKILDINWKNQFQ